MCLFGTIQAHLGELWAGLIVVERFEPTLFDCGVRVVWK